MRQALPTRELITLDGQGIEVRGTLHKPRMGGASVSTRDRVGVVFLNSLSDPRSSSGDTAVYWAESLATCGYPSFRLDLPGLGDSEGDPSNGLLSFITLGGYASIASSKIKEVVDRFELSGVVVVGHCAGAVTAIYAGSERQACKGLVLIDPYFTQPKWITSKLQPEVVHWARRTRAGTSLRRLYEMARDAPRAIRPSNLPSNANTALLSQWKQVASTGLPILILKSPGLDPRPGQFDYLKYAVSLAGRRSEVSIQLIEDTDHSFANTLGKEAVRQCAATWMSTWWPQTKLEDVGEAPCLNQVIAAQGDAETDLLLA